MSQFNHTGLRGITETPVLSQHTDPFFGAGQPAEDAVDGLALGAFQLRRVLGEGGMGVIYGAIHRAMSVPVAVKMITRAGSEHPRFRQALLTEIRAVCALNHPAIVRVLDQGEVPAELEESSGGVLRAGTPYLAMEYVSQGTLADVCGKVTWKQAKGILLTILDALSHAHAMDVIHRDIKPSNILLGEFGDRVIPKVADFGLAFGTENGVSLARAVGTPNYMAPEQISQPWRKHGPWSDLYALGCVAFELLTGKRAFHAATVRDIANCHLEGRRREFLTTLHVPDGLMPWLDRMLAIDTHARFQTAADAARALLEIDDSEVRDVRPPEATRLALAAITPTLDVFRVASGLNPTSAVEQSLQDIPDEWRAPQLDRMPLRLLGAGLGVFGLRTVPLVGRATQLDTLWRIFRQTDERRRLDVAVLRGTAGAGRTRLGDAFVQRIRELGVATVLRVTHSAEGAPSDGLSAMVARYFRTVGASATERELAVFQGLAALGMATPYDVQAVCALCEEADGSSRPEIEFSTSHQRFAVVKAFLRQLAAKRPVVVWADDLQWSASTLAFVEFLLRDKKMERVFVVGSWAEGVEVEEGAESVWNRVQGQVQEVSVPTLTPVEHRELLDRLVPLASDETLEICERTSGNPGFLVEVVGDWVARGILAPTVQGFRVVGDVSVSMPGDWSQMWQERVDALARGDERMLRAMELAAALGMEIHAREWQAACELAELDVCEALVTRLLAERTVVLTDFGWRFVHPKLRQALESGAVVAGRWAAHKRLCAQVLRQQDQGRVDIVERLGRSLLTAGESGAALGPLWQAAEMRRRTGAFVQCQQNLHWYLQAAGDEAARQRGLTLRARALINAGDPRGAMAVATEVLSETSLPADVEVDATLWRAMAGQMLGDSGAKADVERAYTMATGDVDLPGHTYTSLAFLLTNLRRFGPAREMLERARARAENEHDVAFQLHMATRTAGFAGAWDDVERLGKEALERLERLGHLPAAASVLEYLAEAQRKTGHLEGARKVLERVLEVQEAVGGTTVIARMNLGSVALSLGDFEAAERHLVHGLQEAKAIGRRVLILVALAGLLCTAAGLERPAQVEELTATLRAEFDVGVPAEGDIAEHLERAGRLMASRPELSGNAQGVLMLSMRVYEALGHMEKVDELRALLNELDVFPWDVAMAAEPDKQP